MNLRKLFTLLVFAFNASNISAQQNLKLWYTTPATKWTEALPIGNGRIGAMIFGGLTDDRIQFNEQNLWTGAPRNYNKPGASEFLPQIRKLLFEGKQAEAEKLAEEQFMGTKSNDGDKAAWIRSVRSLKGMDADPSKPGFDDSHWKSIKVPSYDGWEAEGLEGMDGAVWFRTTFELPSSWVGKNLVLDLNRVRDQDYTYINGLLIGNSESTDPRKYVIPSNKLVRGVNTISIQVLNFFDKGGIAGYKDTTKHIGIYPEGGSMKEEISLSKIWKYFIQDDSPPPVPHYQADYQPFGDVHLKFESTQGATNYHRELDIADAISRTSFLANGVHYVREYFVSQPNQVMVIHLSADKPGSISFSAMMNSPHKNSSVRKIDEHTIALSVQVRNGALHGEALLRMVVEKGSVQVKEGILKVEKADQVILYLAAATNFKNYKDVSGDPMAICEKAIDGLKEETYEHVLTEHKKEYHKYFNTLSINLGNSSNELPTNERINQFATSSDPSLVALYLQYGRYLLISSSRPGGRPANLQGIWNDLLTPPWGSKYTTNINLEMNYWPAELLNLSPMAEPLFTMIEQLSESGKETAKDYYDAPGWVLHHNTDLWLGTAPINASNHGIWVSGSGWLSHHLWEHYLYSQDKTFLRDRAYPVMKQSALFYDHYLVKDPKTGWLISGPSNSPEHGGLVMGPTMDHQVIRDVFKNVITASELLGVDTELRARLKEKYAQIAPNQIGKYGQLQEWLEDKDDPKDNHRHVSHLWGVHPGNDITWDTPELMKAARQSLLERGDAATGWSLAWKINLWTRFKDGDHAFKLIRMLLSPAEKYGEGSYPNLFDAHPPFQIDGNFGGAAGIGEMLLQSHTKYIDLLPALPSSLPSGEIKGICARGGFVLDIKWKDGKLEQTTVLSTAGQDCFLRYNGMVVTFKTQKGSTYHLNSSLQKKK